jgi:murein DD-endopeptidase MepM/ murein hydrolase activator NlpD
VKSLRDSHVLQTLRAENTALQGQLNEFQGALAELEEGIEWTGQREREARLLAGLDPVDDQTRRLGIGGPLLRNDPSPAIKNPDLRTLLRDEGLRLDNLVRQVQFQKASYSEVLANLMDRKEELARIPTISPILNGYSITSGFGPRRDPFTGRRAQHNGLDFRAVIGTPVMATADGTVSFVGRNGDFGLTIEMKHGGGIETVYCHLKSASVRSGQEVTRGERIGKVGNSGRSTGSHLHYEVRVDGRPVNPKKHILTPSVIVD